MLASTGTGLCLSGNTAAASDSYVHSYPAATGFVGHRIDLHFRIDRQAFVLGQFYPAIPGDRPAQVRWQLPIR